jgi:deoxyribonucleoside regulator
MVVDIDNDELLLRVARLYYVDGLSQVDVARMANVSQAKISRLLAKARQKGFVQIHVAEYDPRNHLLESQLTERLGLRHAVVIKTSQGLHVPELRQSLAHFAAPWVAGRIRPNNAVALAGGRVMQWLVHSMQPPCVVDGVTVIQAMGNIDATVGPYDALELGRIIAQRWGGEFLTLNTPALLPNARTQKTLLALDTISHVIERFHTLQLALVGVGTLENSVFVERGVWKQSDVAKLAKVGVVGEICGRFYDHSGQECNTPYRDRVISIELSQLKKVDDVIAVVVGNDRTKAIHGALRGGLIKSLVIDEAGATALLEAEGRD